MAGAASIVGTAIGIALSPLLLEPTASLLGHRHAERAARGHGGGAASSASSPSSACSPALPAWRAGRLGVLEAIALGRTSVSTKPSRAARAAAALHLPPAVVLGVKDAFANRSRAAMTIASLALTMGTVIMALGTEATYRRVIQDSSLRAKPYELIVDANDMSPARTRALLGAQSARGRRRRRRSRGPRPRCPAARVDVWARALGGDYQRRPYAVRDGRMIAGPGEAIVGRGLLDALSLHVGDRLPLEAEGARLDLRIVGRYVEPDNDGADRDLRPPLGPAGRARALRTRAVRAAAAPTAPTRTRCRPRCVRSSQGQLDVEVTEDGVRQERSDLRPVVYGTDAVLLAIGLVNLLTTLLLGIRERVRDFAIFKVVGLTPRQVLAAVTSGGTLLVVGRGGRRHRDRRCRSSTRWSSLTNPTDGPDLVTAPTWWWVVLMFPAALVFTTLASLLPGAPRGGDQAGRGAALRMSQRQDGDRAGRHLGQPGVDDARDARPPRRERREPRCPGCDHAPGAAGGDPVLELAGVRRHHRGVGDLGHRLARAHDRRRVQRVGHRAGLLGRLLGRRLQRAAHRLQALEQRPALRAQARRQRDDRLALDLAGERVGLGQDLLPLRGSCARAGTPCRALAPGGDRLRVLGLGLEDAQAGDRRRARQLARAGQLGDGAAAQDEVHAQRVASHFALLCWRKAESRSLRAAGAGEPPGRPAGPGANRHFGVARRREPVSSPRRRTRQRRKDGDEGDDDRRAGGDGAGRGVSRRRRGGPDRCERRA